MKCKLVRQNMLDYTEHLLDSHAQQQVACHLQTCRECSQELEAIRETLKLLSSGASFQEPPEAFWNDFTTNVMRKVRAATPPTRPRWSFSTWQTRAAMACALALVLLAAFAVYQGLRPQPPILTTQTDAPIGDRASTPAQDPTIRELVPETLSRNMLATEFALFDDLGAPTADMYSDDTALDGLLLGLSEEEKRALLFELDKLRAPSQ